MKKILRLAVIIVAGLALFVCEANADTYKFSFSNIGLGAGAVNGTVEGRIIGLPYNGTWDIGTQVVIDSWPTGLFSTHTLPVDATLWPVIGQKDFTAVNGVVSGGFIATSLDGTTEKFYLNGAGFNFLTMDSFHTYVYGDNGLGLRAANITHVPEPASMFLLGLGLIGVAGIRRRMEK